MMSGTCFSSGYLYYNIGAEVCCFIIIVVMAGLMRYMKPRKTKHYRYLQSGLACSVFVSLVDIMIGISSGLKGMPVWVPCVLMLAGILLYYACLADVCFYVLSLVPGFLCVRRERAGKAVYAACTVLAWTVLISHTGFMNRDGMFTLSYYISVAVCASWASALFVLVFFVKNRKRLAGVVYRGVLFFLPFDLVLLMVQCIRVRTLFLSVSAALPLFGFYMFFHANPFDEVMGCQGIYAMEICFNQHMKEKNPFYFGILRIPRLIHSSFSSDDADSVEPLVKLARRMESGFPGMHVFRRTAGEFYMVYDTAGVKNPERDVLKISCMIARELSSAGLYQKSVMLSVRYTEQIRSINMMMDIMEDAVRRYSDRFGNCARLLSDKERDVLVEAYKLSELLESLRDSRRYDNENIICYAQPIYEVGSGQFRTAEALMRLSVDGRMVPPSVFVPIAEANSCIHFLTLCMFHKVCAAVGCLMQESDFDAVSINVSVQEFCERGAAEEFLSVIRSYHVPVDKIRVELTESALATDSSMLSVNMRLMADAGIQFYLDDFGTGYSSLERLTELPFSVVKFDKSLLYSALKNEKTDRLINGIVPIIKGDHFAALVEGVEDDDQYAYSVDTGFEYVQGYRWAKPVPVMNLARYFPRREMSGVS